MQRSPYLNFPADLVSLCGGDYSTLLNTQKNENLGVTKWNTALNYNDVIQFVSQLPTIERRAKFAVGAETVTELPGLYTELTVNWATQFEERI